MSTLTDKRLVIFGCGYVCSAVAEAAIAGGARVEALTRNEKKAAALRAAGMVHVVEADLASSDWHGQIEGGPDFVVNTVSSGGPAGYQRSYVGGMQSILEWARVAPSPIKTLVYTSSTSVYPQGGGVLVDETVEAPGATPNGAIIRESELLLQNAPPSVSARWFVLRLAGIYGPGRHHLLDQLREGMPTLNGAGTHRLNLVHRDDIVSAILACLQAPTAVESAIFNVADDAPAWRGEVVQWLAEQLKCPPPKFDGSTTGRRGGAPMPDRIISNRKIRQELGWRPKYADYQTGFREILAATPKD
jgi:nucleoside-diphosphate-sugar epimerase